MQTYSTSCHKIWWKGGTRATKKTLMIFGGNGHACNGYVKVGIGVGLGLRIGGAPPYSATQH